MKRTIILFFILLSIININAQIDKYKLSWKFKMNQSFTIDKFTDQTIIKNGKMIRNREIRDYVILTPYTKTNDMFYLKGRYYSYQRPLNTKQPFQLNEIYELNFGMDKQGFYKVPKKYIMPTIRNIPIFPKEKISHGHTWNNKGIEIMEFHPPVTIPVDVNYQFAGIDNKTLKRPCAKIVFSYILNNIVDHKHQDIPYKYTGSSYSTLWYDFKTQLPIYIDNVYDISFIYYDKTVIQYKGKLKGYYNLKRFAAEKKKIEKEIYTKLKKDNKDLNIKKSKEGIVIDIKDIYFKFNKADLIKKALIKLKNISKVLKNYKDFKLTVKGHTDITGSKEFNQRLSEKRAKTVLEYFIKNKVIENNQGSYKGYGKDMPIADNSTKKGRSKNRRVEIVITPE